MKNNQFFYEKNQRFLCVSLSAIGQKNLEKKSECQDFSLSATYNAQNGQGALSVVCDGHGSDACPKSEFGAKIATEITEEITNNYILNNRNYLGNFDSVLQEIVQGFRQSVLEFNAQVFCESNSDIDSVLYEYGTTLCFAVALHNSLCVAQLGDGAVALSSKDGVRLHNANTKKVDALTNSLCQADAIDRFSYQIYDLTDIDFVLLCSDGIFDLYETDEDFFEFVKAIRGLNWASFDRDKAESVLTRVINQLNDCGNDDMSIAIIARIGE